MCSSRTLPIPHLYNEKTPDLVSVDWHTIRAEIQSSNDAEIDYASTVFEDLAERDYERAVACLGMLAVHNTAVFDAYCARTRAHRLVQHQWIIENPCCVIFDPTNSKEQARLQHDGARIQILAELATGVPKLETDARRYALRMSISPTNGA